MLTKIRFEEDYLYVDRITSLVILSHSALISVLRTRNKKIYWINISVSCISAFELQKSNPVRNYRLVENTVRD